MDQKAIEQPKTLKTFKATKELTPRMQQVVEYLFNNPKATRKQIGQACGISESRVTQIFKSKRVLAAFPLIARVRVRNMIPRAIQAQMELIEQKENLMVRDKASARVLESENVFTPQPIVQINQFQQLSTEDLARIVEQKHTIGKDIVDGELVGPDETGLA